MNTREDEQHLIAQLAGKSLYHRLNNLPKSLTPLLALAGNIGRKNRLVLVRELSPENQPVLLQKLGNLPLCLQ